MIEVLFLLVKKIKDAKFQSFFRFQMWSKKEALVLDIFLQKFQKTSNFLKRRETFSFQKNLTFFCERDRIIQKLSFSFKNILPA